MEGERWNQAYMRVLGMGGMVRVLGVGGVLLGHLGLLLFGVWHFGGFRGFFILQWTIILLCEERNS